MFSLLDLENSEKWQTRDSHSQFIGSAGAQLFEYTSAVTFASNVICTLVDNSVALETWNFAGWLAQKVNIPVGPATIATTVNPRRLWLRQKQLLIFPENVANYQLTVSFPKWFDRVSFTVWEYQN